MWLWSLYNFQTKVPCFWRITVSLRSVWDRLRLGYTFLLLKLWEVHLYSEKSLCTLRSPSVLLLFSRIISCTNFSFKDTVSLVVTLHDYSYPIISFDWLMMETLVIKPPSWNSISHLLSWERFFWFSHFKWLTFLVSFYTITFLSLTLIHIIFLCLSLTKPICHFISIH